MPRLRGETNLLNSRRDRRGGNAAPIGGLRRRDGSRHPDRHAGVGGGEALVSHSGEGRAVARQMFAPNVGGVVDTITPLLPRFVDRGRGHTVIMSSLAGLPALPDIPACSASKAAIRLWPRPASSLSRQRAQGYNGLSKLNILFGASNARRARWPFLFCLRLWRVLGRHPLPTLFWPVRGARA